jgi:16S rRNA processing protein RimM
MAAGAQDKVCLGIIAGAHGVRGEIKVQSYTRAPRDILAYGPLSDERGQRRFAMSLVREERGRLVMRLPGIADRDAAQALAGTRLFVERARLPAPPPDEFYHNDLLGLAAEEADGSAFGRIAALHDFGAGDLVELERPSGERVLLAFTRDVFPLVDVAAGRVVVAPPAEIDAEERTDEEPMAAEPPR